MADQDAERKDGGEPIESVPVVDIQRRISELMSRAAFGGDRIVLTRNGKEMAAIVGMKDLERLRAQDAREVDATDDAKAGAA